MARHNSTRARILLAAAAVFAAGAVTACDKSPTEAPVVTQPLAATPVKIDTLRGTLQMVDDSTASYIRLTTDDGTQYTLIGAHEYLATAVLGQEVIVTGELEADQMYVNTVQFVTTGDGCPSGVKVIDDPGQCLATINPRRSRRP